MDGGTAMPCAPLQAAALPVHQPIRSERSFALFFPTLEAAARPVPHSELTDSMPRRQRERVADPGNAGVAHLPGEQNPAAHGLRRPFQFQYPVIIGGGVSRFVSDIEHAADGVHLT